jgi:cell wall-associated NlpC family hydrolase
MLQIIFYLLLPLSIYAQKAIVIKPVSDLLGSPRTTTTPIPYAQQHAYGTLCPRLHQLLYHDVVEIIQQGTQFSYVRVPDFWYQTRTSLERCNSFWIHNDDLLPATRIKPNDWQKVTGNKAQQQSPAAYVTLTAPWYCKQLRTTFAVGTKFYRTDTQKTSDYYTVYALHPKLHTPQTITIPDYLAFEPTAHTFDERFAYYQQLIKRWSANNKIIPYVWGGCSIQHACRDNRYHEVQHTDNIVYRRLHEPIQKTGVDCAGLIMLAARTAGLPYPLKNTTTIARNGTSTTAAKLEVGDILWVPGHVMLILDPHKGMLLEASHYTYGVGCVRAVHVSKLFTAINSFADIECALAKKMPLQRRDRNGKVYQKITQAKLISMRKTVQDASLQS